MVILTFIPSWNNPKEISYKIRKSKMNKKGIKLDTVSRKCNCNGINAKIPCIVHTLKKYILRKNEVINKQITLKDDLFLLPNGRPLRYYHLNNFLHNVIIMINRNKNLRLNPIHYKPHSLRMGGCTDWARDGKPGWFIEQVGRWSSKVWKECYINLDFSDLALITGTSQSDLRAQIKNRPYVE